MLWLVPDVFDTYADRYEESVERAIGFAGVEHDLFLEAKARALLSLARELGDPGTLDVLDVGCGNAGFDLHLQPHVRALHGVDVSARMVAAAQQANPAGSYLAYDGTRLPYDDGRFDLTFAVCTFHHVEQGERPALAAEMARVTRPGGIVAIAEHNPRNPLTRLVVARCDFDEGVRLVGAGEARRLLAAAGLTAPRARYLLVAPTLAAPWLAVERRLARVPLGAQYVAAGTKPAAPG